VSRSRTYKFLLQPTSRQPAALLATKVPGSKRRHRAKQRVAAHHRKIANRRRDFAHQTARRLVNDHDLIVYEDLMIKDMTRRPQRGQS
jgi:putative transposase